MWYFIQVLYTQDQSAASISGQWNVKWLYFLMDLTVCCYRENVSTCSPSH